MTTPPSIPAPDLIDKTQPGSNLPEYSVSDLSRALKQTVEDRFGLVRVRGEIGECKFHASGHVYLSLKDDKSILAAVIWKGGTGRLGLRPEIGMDVICIGRLTIYPGQSKYQLVIESMALAGEGALLKMIEERKRRLAAEGLFVPERKKKLPWLPEVIGVVTSPTGAVIRDILHRLSDRFPRHVLLWPVAVQGPGAAEQVAAAIAGFNALPPDGAVPRPDVLIVARGGGSIEDLMAFNEEIVVRAAAASIIPLISAVGHETDTTLIDFASDQRAPTPTAAAEMAVPVRANLMAQLADYDARLHAATLRDRRARTERLQALVRALGDPRRLLEPAMQRFDERAERLDLAMRGTVERRLVVVRERAAKLRHPREIVNLVAQKLAGETRALVAAMTQNIERREAALGKLTPRLTLQPTRMRLAEGARRLPDLTTRLQRIARAYVQYDVQRLTQATQLLETLSPLSVLRRGYAIVRGADGQAVTSAQQAKAGDAVILRFHDGERRAVVDGKAERQGTLF